MKVATSTTRTPASGAAIRFSMLTKDTLYAPTYLFFPRSHTTDPMFCWPSRSEGALSPISLRAIDCHVHPWDELSLQAHGRWPPGGNGPLLRPRHEAGLTRRASRSSVRGSRSATRSKDEAGDHAVGNVRGSERTGEGVLSAPTGAVGRHNQAGLQLGQIGADPVDQ